LRRKSESGSFDEHSLLEFEKDDELSQQKMEKRRYKFNQAEKKKGHGISKTLGGGKPPDSYRKESGVYIPDNSKNNKQKSMYQRHGVLDREMLGAA